MRPMLPRRDSAPAQTGAFFCSGGSKIPARTAKHGLLPEGRDGVGDESTGRAVAGDGQEDNLVAGRGDTQFNPPIRVRRGSCNDRPDALQFSLLGVKLHR